MNLTMIWGRFFKDEDIKLTSFVTDLTITGQLHLIISFRIKSGPQDLPVFIEFIICLTSDTVIGLSVMSL